MAEDWEKTVRTLFWDGTRTTQGALNQGHAAREYPQPPNTPRRAQVRRGGEVRGRGVVLAPPNRDISVRIVSVDKLYCPATGGHLAVQIQLKRPSWIKSLLFRVYDRDGAVVYDEFLGRDKVKNLPDALSGATLPQRDPALPLAGPQKSPYKVRIWVSRRDDDFANVRHGGGQAGLEPHEEVRGERVSDQSGAAWGKTKLQDELFKKSGKLGKVFSKKRDVGLDEIGVNQTEIRYDVRVVLKTASAKQIDEDFFVNKADTKKGEMERLQHLGFFARPFDYDYTQMNDPSYTEDKCLEVGWKYFARFFGLNDGNKKAQLATKIREYLVGGKTPGELPKAGELAKLRVPGGYNVLHPAGSPGAIKKLPGYSGSSRHEFEKAFHEANPRLGKVPLVAAIELKHPEKDGTDDASWFRAKNTDVVVEVVAPDPLPKKDPAVAPPPRKDLHADALGDPGKGGVKKVKTKHDAGPRHYLDRRVYNTDKWPEVDGDPQNGNAPAALGGKRKAFDDGRVHSATGEAEALFRLGDAAGKLSKVAAQGTHAVKLTTNDDGEALFVFMPSRIGGDRYKLKLTADASVLAPGQRPVELVTGTLVVWRTVRLLHYIQTQFSPSGGAIDPLTKEDFPVAWACDHSKDSTGRICGDCLVREGALETVNFTRMDGPFSAKAEFAKAWCELEVDPAAANAPEDMAAAEIQEAVKRAAKKVSDDPALNQFDTRSMAVPYWFAMADGTEVRYERKLAPSFKPGTAELVAMKKDATSEQPLALTSGGTLAAFPELDLDESYGKPAEKKLVLVFQQDVPDDIKISCVVGDKKADPLDRTADKRKIDVTLPWELGNYDLDISAAGNKIAKGTPRVITILPPTQYGGGLRLGGGSTIAYDQAPAKLDVGFNDPLVNAKVLKIKRQQDDLGAAIDVATGDGAKKEWKLDLPAQFAPGDAQLLVDGVVIAEEKDQGKLEATAAGTQAGYVLKGFSKVIAAKNPKIKLVLSGPLPLGVKLFVWGDETTAQDPFVKGDELGTGDDVRTTFEKTFQGKLKIGSVVLTVDDQLGGGAVPFAADMARFTPIARQFALDVAKSTIDDAQGKVVVEFGLAPPKGTLIGCHFTSEKFFDLEKFFYFPARSPFIFNLHAPWTYNTKIDLAKHGEIPCPKVMVETFTPDANDYTFALKKRFRGLYACILLDGKLMTLAYGGSLKLTTAGKKYFQDEPSDTAPKIEDKTLKLRVKKAGLRKTFTVTYQTYYDEALKDTGAGPRFKKAGGIQLGGPRSFTKQVGAIVQGDVFRELIREINENKGFIPGVVLVQGAILDTFRAAWYDDERPGLSSGPGTFVCGGNFFRGGKHYFCQEADKRDSVGATFQVIATHELGHSMFFKHAMGAGSTNLDQHDYFDICMMSYSKEAKDFCGHCLATLMGLNSGLGSFVTAKGTEKAQQPYAEDELRDVAVQYAD